MNESSSKLSSPPVLQYPDFNKELVLTTDASQHAIGSILSQEHSGKDLLKRWMIYHSWNIPGPFVVPLLGSPFVLLLTKDNCFELGYKYLYCYKPVAKTWAGSQLYIATARPADVEKILTNFLNKSPFLENFNDAMKDTLLTTKVSAWKEQRKMMNPCFNLKIINSFHDTFAKYSRKMVNFLDATEGSEQTNLLSVIWESTYDSAIENLTNVRPHMIKGRYDAIKALEKIKEILVYRFYKPWLLIGFIWKLSNLYKEHQAACQTFRSVVETIVAEEYQLSYTEKTNDDDMRSKRFLPHLIKSKQNKQITDGQILEEMGLMTFVASETTAVTITTILVVLGIYPDIQEKVYQELVSILPTTNNDPTLEEINRLEYLDRVTKGSMRLIPAVPALFRYINEDIKCDPYVFPAGSNVVVPTVLLHRDPDVWPDPEKFDPDRFLPDEVAKRHRCSYIPFSFGLKYGMMSVKLMVAMIVRSLKVRAIGAKSWKDIQCEMLVILKPKNARLVFEKRF
ncbi:cytochrome P450 4C1-like [Zophobas morio]|uniref:cytochrome P450 4C1-like n=1 Tax=Zophobas morio TaxID=2755281 RepID=UPI003083D6A8